MRPSLRCGSSVPSSHQVPACGARGSAPVAAGTGRPRDVSMNTNFVRIVFAATLLISAADQIPLHNTRWVPDESWYGDAGKTLMQEGRLRVSSFPPSDPSFRVDTRPPAMSAALALSFQLFGV